MTFHEIITLFIFSLWLLFMLFCMMLFLFYSKTSYKIESKKDLYAILLMLFCYGIYLGLSFSIRYLRKYTEIAIFEKFYAIQALISSITLGDKIIIFIFFLIIVVFILLMFFVLLRNVKNSGQKLMLYLYQYAITRKICDMYNHLDNLYFFFFSDFLFKYVKRTPKTYGIVIRIWPKPIIFLENIFIYVFIPYLIFFDYLANNATIMTWLSVSFWFSLYMLFRHFHKSLNNFLSNGSTLLSYDLYGFK